MRRASSWPLGPDTCTYLVRWSEPLSILSGGGLAAEAQGTELEACLSLFSNPEGPTSGVLCSRTPIAYGLSSERRRV